MGTPLLDMIKCIYDGLPTMSVGFRPAYARLHELRALVPPGTPMLAATATATKEVRKDVKQS